MCPRKNSRDCINEREFCERERSNALGFRDRPISRYRQNCPASLTNVLRLRRAAPRIPARESRESARAKGVIRVIRVLCIPEKNGHQYKECISRSYKVSRWTSRSSRLERRHVERGQLDPRCAAPITYGLFGRTELGLSEDEGRTKILKDYKNRWSLCVD